MTISIKSFTSNALSAEAGKKLRKYIIEAYEQNPDETIILDFSGIVLFATMFFNASIGYLVKERRQDILDKITTENITSLGTRTFEHSIQNAESILNEENEKIVDESINED